jgi:hypothetical protein
MPNYLAQQKIEQQLDHSQYTGISSPNSLVLKPRTMGSCTRDNGPILHKRKIPKTLTSTAKTLIGF